jgi:pimeloyl-ACP methyl ester carboxylesterase
MIRSLLCAGVVALAALTAPAVVAQTPPAASSPASDFDGDWWGAVTVRGQSVRLGFHVHAGGKSTLDSPDQGARGLELTAVKIEGDSVHLEFGPGRLVYDGKRGADKDTLEGRMTQGATATPLALHRGAEPAAVAAVRKPHPQEPTKPYPYRSEDVGYENAAEHVHLAGTLTLPEGAGPFPAVVLITGSGAQDRDETILGHKPFLVLSDALTRRGIAVLRVDDRGMGQSTGDFVNSTTGDFATDVEASLAYLRSRPEINKRHLGLIGHSEGGIIAPMVAARDPGVSFIVMMAGAGVPGRSVFLYQQEQGYLMAGAPQTKVDQIMASRRKLYAVLASSVDDATALKQVGDILAAESKLTGAPPETLRALAPQFAGRWARYFANYDPTVDLKRLHIPVLALNGSKDTQVDPQLNLPPIRAALANDRQATVTELPGLNHLFQPAVTGQVAEYQTIETTIDPSVLTLIGDWVVAHTRR